MLPYPPSPDMLLLLVLVAIVGLIVLIARFHCNAFIALLLASIFVGLGSGMPLAEPHLNQGGAALGAFAGLGDGLPTMGIAKAFETGVGNTLGSLGMIIGLGTILGKLLAESGAAEVIAKRMVRLFGEERLDYAVMLVAFLVGISVFFGVGIVLLGPIAFTLARETKTPILRLALPLAAGMSTAHGLIPPHPGPMAAIASVHADVGKTILWSVALGLPTALITGPLLARWVAPRVPVEIGGLGAQASGHGSAPHRPGFGISIFTMITPVLLMLLATLADVTLPASSQLRQWADLFGSTTVAMLIAVGLAAWTFGHNVGFTGKQILKFSEDCVAPAAAILLVVGAGGGFSMILKVSGVGAAIAGFAAKASISPLLLGWLIAGLLRIAVGSATVAVTMAGGLMAQIIATPAYAGVNRELLVLAMGAGSLILSHVNDSGFWFVKEYLGMDVQQTLRTWTVVETGIAITTLILILIASVLI